LLEIGEGITPFSGDPWYSSYSRVEASILLLRFFFTLVTGPRRSFSLKLSDTRVYEPQIRARLGTKMGEGTTPFLGEPWYSSYSRV